MFILLYSVCNKSGNFVCLLVSIGCEIPSFPLNHFHNISRMKRAKASTCLEFLLPLGEYNVKRFWSLWIGLVSLDYLPTLRSE